VFRKWDVGVSTGTGWLRLGTGGRHWWMQYWTFRFHKIQRISWLAENRLATQGGFFPMVWVSEFLLNNLTPLKQHSLTTVVHWLCYCL
jgi:hypothetical protein